VDTPGRAPSTWPIREPGSGTADKLLLDDVRFWGQHGLTRAEQAVGAWFSVDAELALDLRSASISDALEATVDYGRVIQRIVEIGTGTRVNLIERLAGLLAEALLREFPADQVRLRVRKLTPPLEGRMGTPGVELTRRR
jgi:dihydroneopterin aldolase